MKDVARAAGVSTATVSRVLSGGRRVDADIAAAVREASDRLGYQMDVVARSLRTQATGTVGMVVPHIANPFFPAIVEAVERALATDGLQLLLCDSQGSVAQESARIRALLSRRVDGLLLIACESRGSGEIVTRASTATPLVLIDRRAAEDGAPADYVGTDHDAGVGLLVDHLTDRGARSFAFVSAADLTSSAHERTLSYRARVKAVDPQGANRTLLGAFSYEWGYEAGRRLLAADSLPDAVVCGADIIALGLLSALRHADIVAPRDLLVTGYDDIGFAALNNPALTTARQPVEQLGREAVRLLRLRMADPAGARQSHVLAPTLMIRESTGPTGHVD